MSYLYSTFIRWELVLINWFIYWKISGTNLWCLNALGCSLFLKSRICRRIIKRLQSSSITCTDNTPILWWCQVIRNNWLLLHKWLEFAIRFYNVFVFWSPLGRLKGSSLCICSCTFLRGNIYTLDTNLAATFKVGFFISLRYSRCLVVKFD